MIYIITPLYRYRNIPIIYKSLKKHILSGEITWIIVVDAAIADYVNYQPSYDNINLWMSPHRNAFAGHAHRNFALDKLKEMNVDRDSVIYFLDDDNVLHKHFVEEIQNSHASVVVFSQYVRRKYLSFLIRVRKGTSSSIRIAHIDTAMYAFRLKALKGIRWREDIYEADGLFIEELKAKNSIQIINKTLSYYNWIK
jgi:hypothetical protein